MTLHTPFIDVSINADWSDWQNFPNGRPNPLYTQQCLNWGANGLVLGFITLSSANTACWAAQPTMGLDWSLPLAQELKQASPDNKIAISFGGASNSDISSKFTIEELEKTYAQAIEMYKADQLDFDFENGLYDMDKTCTALKTICSKYPNVKISFTLPVLPSGLTSTGMGIITKARDAGIEFIVNGMAMDYYQPEWNDKMGDAGVEVIKSLKDQMKTLYPSLSDAQLFQRVAVTPMIGLNDDLSMFTIPDATKVSSFAKSNNIAFTSSWDLNRDNPSSFTYVDLQTSSNPNQKNSGDYTTAFVNATK